MKSNLKVYSRISKKTSSILFWINSAKEFIVDKGFDEKYGARPLKRAIQKYVEDPLAEEILRGSFKEGTKIIANMQKMLQN